MDDNFRQAFEFGPFRLIPEERQLFRDSQPVALTPKAFDMLVALVENRGRLVTKDQLMQRIWPDSFVEEANLSVKMSALRRALGEGPHDQHFIQTVQRQGYRFVADVTETSIGQVKDRATMNGDQIPGDVKQLPTSGSETVPNFGPQRLWYRLAIPVVGLLGFAALIVAVNAFGLRDRLLGPPSVVRIRSLAVLPMANLSGDQSQDYFADGMTDTLISGLAKVRALKVISRTSVFQYKGGQKNISAIGRELNVDAVVEGSVQRIGDRVKITVQLIDTANDHHIWSETYDREFRDVLVLQNEVARAVTGAIQIKLTEQEKSELSRSAQINTKAYDYFWRGRYYLNSQTKENNEKAIAMFEQAVEADPGFASGFAALSQAYVWRFFLFTPDEDQWEEKAFVAAERAMSLDPELADAHLARGRVLWTPKNRFPHEKAIQEYQRALELDPNLDEARNQLALVYNHVGAVDKALEELQRALATNPMNNAAQFRMGETLLFKGDYERAVVAFGSVPNNTNPALTGSEIVWTLWNLGRTDEALTTLGIYLEKYPDDNRGLFTSIQAVIAAASGHFDESNEKIKQAMEKGKGFGHFHHTMFQVACAYARMNKPEKAVELLERVAKDGFPCFPLFEKDPNLNNIRQDPRFIAFLADVKKQSESYYSNP